jgi:hypothetical protein
MSEQSIPQIIELADGTKCVRLEDFLNERDEARAERDSLQVMRKEVVAANKGAKINAQVSNSLAGKLNRAERERDEAREALASREVVIAQHSVITDLILERDKWAKLCVQYEQERDEAMLKLKNNGQ